MTTGQQQQIVLDATSLGKTYRRAGQFGRRTGTPAPALIDASIRLMRGSTLGVIGESGSGKTTLARCLTLLERPDTGTVLLNGTDLTELRGKALRVQRRTIQTVFQDPYSSLNPSQTVGSALDEVLRVHRLTVANRRACRVRELLDLVGLPAAAAQRRPAEFSGGQRQRICIARALAAEPTVLIADEAVSALDVSVQAQILNLLLSLQSELHLSMIFISHDLHVVDYVADSTVVMFAGRIVERRYGRSALSELAHPYSVLLARTSPQLTERPDGAVVRPLPPQRERGEVDGAALLTGCPFRLRCPEAMAICTQEDPQLRPWQPDHDVACHLHGSVAHEGEPA
ncbi:MAG: putative oligopeptide transporter, ATP-binding component [Streptosporangiaceae bacterium]|jgi:oligopeptide/dipeptide ABC transporter ATP-binding protein|nr:putative oligopeptide transporter, ATP-binding component [Streptosporangiaceae bacterium]